MSDTPPMPPPLPTPVDPDAPPERAEPLDVAVRLEVAARVAGALGITALALLMVLTGRRHADAELHGPGRERLDA